MRRIARFLLLATITVLLGFVTAASALPATAAMVRAVPSYKRDISCHGVALNGSVPERGPPVSAYGRVRIPTTIAEPSNSSSPRAEIPPSSD